jgi:hypothetical protein
VPALAGTSTEVIWKNGARELERARNTRPVPLGEPRPAAWRTAATGRRPRTDQASVAPDRRDFGGG